MRGEVKRQVAFKVARRMLRDGYPVRWIAIEAGVHRNTILAWSRRLGYSINAGHGPRSRQVNGLVRRALRLTKAEARALLAVLADKIGLTVEAAA